MNDFKQSDKEQKQLSILGFVEVPDPATGLKRSPRSRSKKRESTRQITSRDSLSLDSKSTKRKASNPLIVEPEVKRQIMETDDNNKTPSTNKGNPAPAPENAFTKALKEMEDCLTNNMKDLQMSLDTLLNSQQEWLSHKEKVSLLEKEKVELKHHVTEVEKKNNTLETRIKKLEERLMECNIIVHGVKESAWEPDSTR